ncbi:cell division inhibitor [Halarchaeum acidiphilum MH1-52-1]|uniref:Cell division inhibitor n=1 Tax=Halarchaeum acidiphilum MH1-52-1 TaxID=1261545 RepID=U2YTD0_9EURY|nr:AAA family ATPase [Halarchaeum acidiphilum]GAD52002.1 cell division inhibitor [Halarchaeum acidiphilum MH1-52-1]
MSAPRTLAVVGAAGGVGATRLSVEAAALVAATGHDALVLDANYDTQGLSTYVDARLDPDATALAIDPGIAVGDAAYALDAPGDGALALAPSHAPFGRVADAKGAEAAERLADRVADAADAYDYVFLDTPPVATNPAVAAVTTADQLALVTSADERGRDALSRERGRLADVGVDADPIVVANSAAADALADAHVAVPDSALGPESDAPAGTPADPDDYTRAVASFVERAFAIDDLVPEDAAGLLATLRRRLA